MPKLTLQLALTSYLLPLLSILNSSQHSGVGTGQHSTATWIALDFSRTVGDICATLSRIR